MLSGSIKEGQLNCRGGASSAYSPDELPDDSIAWAKNVTLRGGKPTTRPALIERLRLPRGRLQGIGYFSAGGGMFVAQIDGKLYRITASGSEFKLLRIPLDFINSPRQPTAWFCETDGSLVIQDGQSAPVIYDGSEARRSDRTNEEVPIGRMMAYGNGRLWVVINDHEVVAGDIKDSPFQSELKFTETGYLTGGGAFYFPGKLRGLAFLPVVDTASGKGPLMVFSAQKTETLRADVTQRDMWQELPGFVSTALQDVGSLSHHAIVPINQDLYFRSHSGDLRSVRSARAEAESAGESPLSNEVSRLFDFESTDLLDSASGIYWRNRLLMTASPFIGKRGQVMFRHIMPLDLSPQTSMRGRIPPAYDGQWDGISFVRLIRGEFDGADRAFAVTCDSNGTMRLMEIDPSERADRMDGALSAICAAVEYRQFGFGDFTRLKRLECCKVFLKNMEGAGTVTAYFRSDHHPQWIQWDSFEYCASMTEAESGVTPHTPKNLHAQFRNGIGTFTIPHEISSITQHGLHVGYGFQIRLVWTGYVTIDRMLAWASPVDETEFANRDDLETECTALTVSGNEVVYEIPTVNAGFYADHESTVYTDHTADNYADQ